LYKRFDIKLLELEDEGSNDDICECNKAMLSTGYIH